MASPKPRNLLILLLFIAGTQQTWATDDISVFRRPALMEQSHELQLRAVLLSRTGQIEAGIKVCEEAVKIAPFSPPAQYNLACLYSRNGEIDKAIDRLKIAAEVGFRDANHVQNDPDLVPLRDNPEFKDVVEAMKKPFETPKAKLNPLENGIGWVGPENTVWDEPINMLRTGFEWKRPAKSPSIITGHGEIGKRLHKWFGEGTAAGNFGDLYDNCDRDHSNLAYAQFPQLNRIEYRPEILSNIPFGFQNRFLHGGVVIGNSSTSLVNSPIWRSNPRMAYTTPTSIGPMVRQYFQNHLYVYPEHNDHDPGHNGEGGGGYGDVYPTNTPYMLISQGSSYTDIPFVDALTCTLAAFRPPVKQRLVESGALAPTLQQIFRNSYKLVKHPDDYLTGIAHPSVFEGSEIDALKMVDMAHAMSVDDIPPLARIRVEQEDHAILGRDYFEVSEREKLFDTACAIARIGRSTQFRRHMIVSAKESLDLDKRPLKFKWVILRGDESRISIKPLDEEGARADITVAWHPRRKIRPDSPIESNRVDIGVFAHNGVAWSAPAFITWYFLDNEDREYDKDGRILSVAYHGGIDVGNYADPLIQTPKSWKDTYHYSEDGRPTGWTRKRGAGADTHIEEFTPEGGLIIEKDDQGRPAAIRVPRYIGVRMDSKPLPSLVQQESDEVFRYVYANDEDRIGKLLPPERSPRQIEK